jgi:hypothetical protein
MAPNRFAGAPMWTNENRSLYDRSELRYPSDLTDEEWFNRCRRLAKDWECLNKKALAFLRWASIRLMLRKLCRKTI